MHLIHLPVMVLTTVDDISHETVLAEENTYLHRKCMFSQAFSNPNYFWRDFKMLTHAEISYQRQSVRCPPISYRRANVTDLYFMEISYGNRAGRWTVSRPVCVCVCALLCVRVRACVRACMYACVREYVCVTWDIRGLRLISFRLTEWGSRLLSSWHNNTPSLSACANSHTCWYGHMIPHAQIMFNGKQQHDTMWSDWRDKEIERQIDIGGSPVLPPRWLYGFQGELCIQPASRHTASTSPSTAKEGYFSHSFHWPLYTFL